MFWLSNCTGGPPNTWFVWSNRLEEGGEDFSVEFKIVGVRMKMRWQVRVRRYLDLGGPGMMRAQPDGAGAVGWPGN